MTPLTMNFSSAAPLRSSERALVDQIAAEYEELPGLNLTLPQAVRLFAADRPTCSRALDELVQAGFLVRDDSEHFVRVTDH